MYTVGMYLVQDSYAAHHENPPAIPPRALQALVHQRRWVLHVQVLLANAQMLSGDYTRRCRREWGIGNPGESAFEASFLAPARLLDADQLDKVQTQCASSSCSKPAVSVCIRCKVGPRSSQAFLDVK